jgi:hypothetical protein
MVDNTGEVSTDVVGVAGVELLKRTGSLMKQKKLNAGFSKVTITDDTGNNEVDGDAPNAAQVNTTNALYLA